MTINRKAVFSILTDMLKGELTGECFFVTFQIKFSLYSQNKVCENFQANIC